MFIDIGYNNFVSVEKIITIGKSESSPIKRICREAKDGGKYIDLTQGKKTRSVIVTAGNADQLIVIGTPLQTTTIVSRIKKMEDERATLAIENEHKFIIGEGSSTD